VTVRDVLRIPHAVLKTPARPVGPGPDAEQLIADLVDTMRASPACVGLAAPQIGEPFRAFCLDIGDHKRAGTKRGLVVMIDPVIEHRSGAEIAREGCMSVPDFTGNVRRATEIVVRGMLPNGEEIIVEADAFEARALQHELDHLDGLLFLDRVASLTSEALLVLAFRRDLPWRL